MTLRAFRSRFYDDFFDVTPYRTMPIQCMVEAVRLFARWQSGSPEPVTQPMLGNAMYDSPKAAHFVALDGSATPANQSARWEAASIALWFTHSMIGLSAENRDKINTNIRPLGVKLRDADNE